MGVFDLFTAATVPVIKVLLMTAVGAFLATSRINILNEDARKHLNNVVFYVFNPALVCANLSQTVTYESIILLWFMPVNILIIVIVGSALGRLVICVTNPPPRLRGLILGCCASGNWGTLLLIIIPAICKEKGSPFGAPDICSRYGLAYVSLSMAMGAIFLWLYVYNIVRICSSESTVEDGCMARRRFHGEDSKLLVGSSTTGPSDYIKVNSALQNNSHEHETPKQDGMALYVHPKHFLELISGEIHWKKLFAPSTIGVIIGFVIGMTPKIRTALVGRNAPLRVIEDSVHLMSEGAIPTLTLITGGNLNRGICESTVQVSYVVGIIFVRYGALPLLGTFIVIGGRYLGLIHSDPLYQFVLLIQFAVPPAMNIGTITQLFEAGESECSVIFLWTYALASVSLTLWSTFFMWLVSL